MKAEEYFDWVERERRKHRVMTAAEYSAWYKVGDAISHPSTGNAFPGGITITFGPDDSIFGHTLKETD